MKKKTNNHNQSLLNTAFKHTVKQFVNNWLNRCFLFGTNYLSQVLPVAVD